MYQNFIILNLYESQHVLDDAPPSCVDVVRYSVPDNVYQLHVQQPSMYQKPEAASAVLGS